MNSKVKWRDASQLRETITRLTAELAIARASEEGALMILTQTIAERDAARAELRKAVNRLEWCAGLLVQDESRQRAFEWVDEMRATINGVSK